MDVDVINFTSSVTLHSQCDITMTEFSYPLPQDAVCHSYVLTISPINLVGRGAPSSMPYIGTEAGMHAMRYSVNKIVMDQSDIDVGAMLGQKAHAGSVVNSKADPGNGIKGTHICPHPPPPPFWILIDTLLASIQ